jgi:NAD(P)-dependent dehydrogenase (short-subunit alcohol dehydrogenase family)
LGAQGTYVILAARSAAACETAATAIRDGGGSAEAVPFDGTDPMGAEVLVETISEAHGRLDGAFNNLGATFGDGPLHETPNERWDATLAVNLTAVFRLMRAQIAAMLRRGGGRIVNNSSTGGLRGTARLADYSAAKWGVIGLTKSASIEYAGQGLVINVIAPGIIATEQAAEVAPRFPEIFDRLRRETPAGRFGEMDEIADIVAWLLGSAPAFLNGAVIPIDGGRTA